ncbi:MAG: hypothetical protein GF418_01405 [Chitinivibrionales bacterium]|nr:hypothetical protein [Chitinivibrionales bacterium]MBD3394259.1 hypothetical protein [Chitinivibrionales bacterium]
MASVDAYRIGARVSVGLLALSFILPLYLGGDYVAGYTVVALVADTLSQVMSPFARLTFLLSYLSAAVIYAVVLASLRYRLFGRPTRVLVLVAFLCAVAGALVANSRFKAVPPGPAGVVLLWALLVAAALYGWSILDARWRSEV